MNIMKLLLGKGKSKSLGCCGVEIEEVEKTEEESCCGTTTEQTSSCC